VLAELRAGDLDECREVTSIVINDLRNYHSFEVIECIFV